MDKLIKNNGSRQQGIFSPVNLNFHVKGFIEKKSSLNANVGCIL